MSDNYTPRSDNPFGDDPDWQGDAALAALGRLPADAVPGFQAQLDGDSAKRAELEDLQAVAAVLNLADPARLDDDIRPAPDLFDRIADQVAVERRQEQRAARSKRTVRMVLVAAALVAVLGVGGVIVNTGLSTSGPELTEFALAPEGSEAAFALEQRDGGTEIIIEVSGLDPEQRYWLWLSNDDGRTPAGTFQGSEDTETLTFTTALSLDDANRLWATDVGGEEWDDSNIVLDVMF
ncbi:MAG: anti-sigma factor [Actinomycetota bacterium]|nr:anti-sigma factor [Actinomycetota bacterium]